MRFYTNASERLRITEDGALGIGGANYGSSGQVLTSGGSGAAPSWADAAGGGNSVDLVADGAIAAGKPCIIKSNGKAQQVAILSQTLATPTFDGSSDIGTGSHGCNQWVTEAEYVSGAWGRTYGTTLLAYRDKAPSPDILEGAMVKPTSSATCSNTVDSVTLASTWPSTNDQDWIYNYMAYDITNNKFILVGKLGSSNKPAYMDITPNSDSSFTSTNGYGTLVNNTTGDENQQPRVVYVGSGRVCFFYTHKYDGANEKVTARIGTWNGSNAYTLGTEVDLCDKVKNYSATWHEHSGKVVFFGQSELSTTLTSPNIGAGEGFFMVGTISGSDGSATISFATHVALPDNKDIGHTDIITDDETDKIVAIGKPYDGSSFTSWVCSLSGTTLTVGSGVAITTSNVSNEWKNRERIVYHDMSKKVLVWYGSSDENSHYVKVGTVSTGSNTITWGNATQWASSNNMQWVVPTVCYGDSSGTVLVSFAWANGGGDGKTRQFKFVSQATNFTSDQRNFLGFAPSAINDGNTGTINLDGNVVENQSGLTAGLLYKVDNDGTLDQSWGADEVGLLAIAADKGVIMRSLA